MRIISKVLVGPQSSSSSHLWASSHRLFKVVIKKKKVHDQGKKCKQDRKEQMLKQHIS